MDENYSEPVCQGPVTHGGAVADTNSIQLLYSKDLFVHLLFPICSPVVSSSDCHPLFAIAGQGAAGPPQRRVWAGARPMSLYIDHSLTLMNGLLDETCFLQSIKGYLI